MEIHGEAMWLEHEGAAHGPAVDVIPAVIASIRDETPTVKRLVFDLGGRPFDFLPGQWIDCYLHPGPDAPVAGYSMTSSPRDTSTIEIAVKRVGGNPVTDYIHGLARAGDTLPIDGGYGDFSYDPSRETEAGPAVALIAGGIGITPLMSMLRAADEAPRSPELTLVYSASSPDEFAFRADIDRIAASNPRIAVHYTITRPAAGWSGPHGHIGRDTLRNLGLGPQTRYYVCGPAPFVTAAAEAASALGARPSHVHYELWS